MGAASPDAHLTARHRVGNARSRLRKFSFAPQHGPALRVARSVGEIAAAGPSGVLSAPRAAVSHSGGVRRHRRYVFAPVIPLHMQCRPTLVEEGHHADLLAANGVYAALHASWIDATSAVALRA